LSHPGPYVVYDKCDNSFARLYKLFDSQPQVIKFTSCLPMVGGSLWVLRFLPPLKLVAMIYLKVALKHQKSKSIINNINIKIHLLIIYFITSYVVMIFIRPSRDGAVLCDWVWRAGGRPHRFPPLTFYPKINRVLPLPQGNHVAKFGKDPIYRTKVIVRKPVWTPARPPYPIT
jgi:hypothetical protein